MNIPGTIKGLHLHAKKLSLEMDAESIIQFLEAHRTLMWAVHCPDFSRFFGQHAKEWSSEENALEAGGRTMRSSSNDQIRSLGSSCL